MAATLLCLSFLPQKHFIKPGEVEGIWRACSEESPGVRQRCQGWMDAQHPRSAHFPPLLCGYQRSTHCFLLCPLWECTNACKTFMADYTMPALSAPAVSVSRKVLKSQRRDVAKAFSEVQAGCLLLQSLSISSVRQGPGSETSCGSSCPWAGEMWQKLLRSQCMVLGNFLDKSIERHRRA